MTVSELQALLFDWAYNQPEALQSLQLALDFDPDDSLLFWASAYSLGPFQNRSDALAAMSTHFPIVAHLIQLLDLLQPRFCFSLVLHFPAYFKDVTER